MRGFFMKKRIFATLALLASMALVGCGKKTCEKHEWGPYEETTPATCTVDGVQTRTCKVCGEKDTKAITAGHKYGEWAVETAATCAAEGVEARVCSVCQNKETRQIPMIDHVWEEKDTVAKTGEDDVSYINIECSMCHKKGIRIAAAQAEITFTNSSKTTLKTAPEGCVKLPSNGDSMLLKFNVAAAKTGKIYQRGSMDFWYTDSNKNQEKTYYDENSGNTDAANKVGNFKVEVGADPDNLAVVELPDNTALTYGDMLPADVGFEGVDNTNWSQIGDCIVGNVNLSAGMNYVKFTRVDSFNLAIHDFDIIFD
jgi:hypothetical protein